MSGPRAAIVGAGLMGRWHAHALRRLGLRVAAVVDSDPARARRLADACPGAGAADTLAPVLADGSIGVVHVCSPVASHAPLVRAALEAGRHVLVEKPLARDAAETARLLELADARGLLLCPVHQFAFQDGCQRLLRDLDRLGPLVEIAFVACSAGADDDTGPGADEVAADILPHPLSLFARLVSPPLDEIDWSARRPAPGELRAEAVTDGASLSIVVSMRARPTLNQLTVRGERGSAHLDLFHGYVVLEGGTASRAYKVARPFLNATRSLAAATTNLSRRGLRREPAYPGLRELIRRFHDAARAGRPSPIPPAEVLAVARARERILARLGARPDAQAGAAGDHSGAAGGQSGATGGRPAPAGAPRAPSSRSA